MTATGAPYVLGLEQTAIQGCRELADAILNGFLLHEKAHYVETIATRWAKAGIPLELVHKQLWESVRHAVKPGARNAASETADLATLMDTLTTVLTTVSATYLGVLRGKQSARQRLMSALLNGEDTSALSRECGLVIAHRYAAIAIAFPMPESSPAAIANATTRISTQLARHCGAAALARLSDEGGTILVPAPEEDAALDRLLDNLAATTRISLTATTTSAPPAELPAAARRAHELLDIALLVGREGTLHRLSDLAAEYQLTRPGPAREQLAAVLDPLDQSPHLMDTLQLHLLGTLSRRTIARHLNVHVNTIDYRLKRIANLTGLDPLAPAGQWQLRCAMVARSRSLQPIGN